MNTLNMALTDNCRFHLGDEPDAWMAWYDDCAWQSVNLPHDWSVTQPFSREYSSGTGYLAGGIAWYRIHIKPCENWRDKNISITFDGVYKNSRVWCNSYYIGERPNGYIGFTYDITEQFNYDDENIICVYVDHRDIADSRWFTGSGITRKVTLTVSEPVHAVHDGISFSTPYVGSDSCTYQVVGEYINSSPDDKNMPIRNVIYNSSDEKVSECTCSLDIKAGQTATVKALGEIKNPSLWSPESPYLYTLRTFAGDDEVFHAKVGVRSFEFDADKGFFLNGTAYKLKGVCVHHDAGCLGAAVLPEVWYRRLSKLKEMGCNAIRTSHNPHMPELYSLCDGMGFFVMDEAFDEWEGPKNKWSIGHNVYPPKHQGYYVDFPQWHERDLVDMIRRDRNHASVIMWSIGNEIDYPNDPYCHPSFKTMTGNNDANKPAAERQYNPKRPDASRLGVLSKMLCGIVKDTDATRPVTLAAAFPELSTKVGFTDELDVVGYNYKEQLYCEHHKAFPKKPLLGSENSHSYQAWRAVTDNKYISGQFLWTGIDYLGEAKGAWPVHGAGAGLLTLAGFEKTGYWRRQSFWSDKEVIHLATIRKSECPDGSCDGEFLPVGESWDYMDGEAVVVKCYTNLDEVELLINDRSLGIYKRDFNRDCITVNTCFEAGKLTAKGRTRDGGVISYCLNTCECAVGIKTYDFTCDLAQFDIANTGLHQLEVTLVDRHGNRVYNDSSMLCVEVENGRLIGIENGDLSDVTEYSQSFRRAYHGQLIIYVIADSDSKTAPTVTISGEHVRAWD